MLKQLRRKGIAKKILWVVAVVVIISFGFFGKASLLNNNQANYAGKIFGRKISFDDFRKVYRQVQLQAILHYGEDFDTINSMINLEAETWNRLILLHAAKQQNIKVTDEEVVKTIEQYPFFQREGEFDSLLYKNALRYAFRVKPREFEESIRNTIKIAKLRRQQTRDIQLNDKEIFQAYKKQNEKSQVSYVLVKAETFIDDVTVEPAYLKQYYEEHKTEFLKPASIQVDYIKVPFPEKADADTEAPQADPSSKYDTYQKTERIYQALLDGQSLDTVASQHDTTVQTTDYFSIEKPLFMFGSFDALNQIFHLNVNEISEPLETNDAMFIVRMKDKKEAYIPSYDEARDAVQRAVKKNEAKRIARAKAEQYHQQIKDHLDANAKFLQTVKKIGLDAHQTPLFNRGQYLPIVGLEKSFQEAAFQLNKKNPLNEVVEISKGYCILHLDAYQSVDKKDFMEEKDSFQQKLLAERRMQRFNDYFARLKAEANLSSNLKKQ
jgi:peptidyl-prolyl cis-trans isomerase D